MRLADKTALIPGAGSGMGRLACQLFAREGASIVALDITEDSLRETAASVESEGGGIVDVGEGVWQRVLDVNLKGVALCCKYGIPELIKAGGGSVINVASFVALVGCTVPQD